MSFEIAILAELNKNLLFSHLIIVLLLIIKWNRFLIGEPMLGISKIIMYTSWAK